jgi:hypothetical protein
MTPHGLAAYALARVLTRATHKGQRRAHEAAAPDRRAAPIPTERSTPMRAAAGPARGIGAVVRHVPSRDATEADERNGRVDVPAPDEPVTDGPPQPVLVGRQVAR